MKKTSLQALVLMHKLLRPSWLAFFVSNLSKLAFFFSKTFVRQFDIIGVVTMEPICPFYQMTNTSVQANRLVWPYCLAYFMSYLSKSVEIHSNTVESTGTVVLVLKNNLIC
jgi:hypothetical protein